jgi:hypothetical protein
MNLHGIVTGYVNAVNLAVPCTMQMSTGYTIAGDGSQVPTYATYTDVPCQIQAASYGDIQKTSGLNIQGTRRSVYLNGDWQGLNRSAIKGGDILTMPDNTVWLVAMVLEHWPDWTKIAITLQNGS